MLDFQGLNRVDMETKLRTNKELPLKKGFN